MLEILKRGNVTIGPATWEYHGDTDDNTLFYITPQPAWVLDEHQMPRIQLVTYQTSGQPEGQPNGSGYCTLQVQLSVPTAVIEAVTANIQDVYKVNPRFLSLPFQPGTLVSLTYPDGQGGTTGQQVAASDFGSNTAIFQLPLDADQMKTMKAALAATGGSPFEVQYNIMVPAIMPSITMELSFNSVIALNYQVTSHEHTHWASSSTYTYDISKQLTSSGASTVTLTAGPGISQADQDRVRDWGQATIESLVAKEVAAALALQDSASGTQSFDVSQISSFTENYVEQQTIVWRLQPQTVLPSFGDLGLTVDQIAALEPTVDVRKFVATVTPACNFVDSEQSLNPSIAPPTGTYLTDEQKLKTLDVTIKYPTLDGSATRTHTFTDNQPNTWEANWDIAAGGVYSLEYVATYANPGSDGQVRQVHGEIKNIEASAYTLPLALMGTLNVVFDASTFFANTGVKQDIKEIDVAFVYNIPQAEPLLKTLRLNSTNMSGVITSYTAAPITTDYFYTVTYIFTDSTLSPFTTDAKQQNGPRVSLLSPVAQQSVAVVAGMNNIYSITANIYYSTPPYFPDTPASQQLPRPDEASPLQLDFPVAGAAGREQTQIISLPVAEADTNGPPAIEKLARDLFANSKFSPLTITASVITNDLNQYTVGPYLFTPQGTVNFTLSETKTFATLGIDPTIVQWNLPAAGGTNKPDTLTAINFNVRKVTYDLPPAPATPMPTPAVYPQFIASQAITWDPQKHSAYSLHILLTSLPMNFQNLAFEWEAEYVYVGGSKFARGTTAGTLLSLPPVATEGPKEKPTLPNGQAKQLTKYLLQWQPSGLLQLN